MNCTWNFVLGKLGNWCSLVSSVHCQSELEAESKRVQGLHKIEVRYLTWLMSAEGMCRKRRRYCIPTFYTNDKFFLSLSNVLTKTNLSMSHFFVQAYLIYTITKNCCKNPVNQWKIPDKKFSQNKSYFTIIV